MDRESAIALTLVPDPDDSRDGSFPIVRSQGVRLRTDDTVDQAGPPAGAGY